MKGYAKSIGKVVDMNFDIQQWTINQLTVKIGLTNKCYVNVDKIDKIGDKVILSVDKDKLVKG